MAKSPKNPERNIQRYASGRMRPDERYASYDHCYNFFQGYREVGREPELASGENIQLSCLHLGFFLASWGMYRGSADLLQNSSSALVPAVNLISNASDAIWDTDVENYDDARIAQILNFRDELGAVVPGGHSGTLTSKIMLGVFGCVPAFDQFFNKGFGTSGFRQKALRDIRSYYDQHQKVVEANRITTIDFHGRPTKRRYTQAKVIDMIFFVEGGGA